MIKYTDILLIKGDIMGKKSERLVIRVTPETKQLAKILAIKKNVTLSDLVIGLLNNMIDEDGEQEDIN